MIEIYILTGAAGSGKSTAQFVFEESGFYVMENVMPVAIRPTLEFLYENKGSIKKYLIVAMPSFAKEILDITNTWVKTKKNIVVRMITLSCDPKILLKRFKLTRHVHPTTALKKISLSDAIQEDIKQISDLQGLADYRIDTSDMSAFNLRKHLFAILSNDSKDTVSLCFMSFGHKHGIPLDIDLVLDTRALPNPYWVEELRKYSGLDKPVQDYLESLPITKETLDHMINYLDFYLQQVQLDGRGNYTIGVCCTGGRHRSVYFADQLAKFYANKYNVISIHRDIDKE